MIDPKLAALVQRGALSETQARDLRRLLAPQTSPYSGLGETVRLVDDPAEALATAKGGRYTLLGIARDPADPERSLFVLRSGAPLPPGKRFGGARTWLLFGIALGAVLNALARFFL